MATTTLADIETMMRRICKAPTAQQLTQEQAYDYINWYYKYTLPDELRQQSLKGEFVFNTIANVDTYNFPVQADDPSFQLYVSVEPPLYINGVEAWFSQDQTNFYRYFPKINQTETIIANGGASYTYTASNTPMNQNSVNIGAVNAAGTTINLRDVPMSTQIGDLYQVNNQTGQLLDVVVGEVDYINGLIVWDYSSAVPTSVIPAQNKITLTYYPYVASRPRAALFYADTFTLRPIPDAEYRCSISAYQNPTELISAGQTPELNDWWELIAIGASMKYFRDRRMTEAMAFYQPIYEEEECRVIRRSIQQQQSQRSSTIYMDQNEVNFNNYFNGY